MLVVPSQQNEKIKALMEQVVPGYNDLPIEATTQISNVSAVIKKPYDPDVTPQDIGRTWVNTATGDRRVSNGKEAISDWIAQTGTSPTPDIVGWSTDIVRSATDYNTVAWTSGTISLADGSNFSVNSGNTGNITAINYIYYDGTTTLKKTTTPQTAVGSGKILLCVAKNSTSPTLAQFQAFGTLGQNVFITADNIAANTITANQIASNTITATQISSDYIYAGTINADNITSGTITGRTVRTAASGTRVELNGSENTLHFYVNPGDGTRDCGYISGVYLEGFDDVIGFSQPIFTTDTSYIGGQLFPRDDGIYDIGDPARGFRDIYITGGLNFDNGDGILTEVSGTPRRNNGTNYGILISNGSTSTSNLTVTGKVTVNISGTTFKLLYNNT